jgi:Uma2 family endonuclease
VAVVRGARPQGRIITEPPEVVVEVLSPEDRAGELLDKVEDYLRFGVPCVWGIDPETRRAFVYTAEGSHRVTDGVLRNRTGDLEAPLGEVFPGGDRV